MDEDRKNLEKLQEEPFNNPSREQISQLQDTMSLVQCTAQEPEHYFAPGMYGRKFFMPAGMLVVGKIHRHAHLMMVLKGKATVITEFGKEEVEAGYVSVSQPGAKRVVLAHEDTLFMTVHVNANDSEDLAEIEKEHIVPENEYLLDVDKKELL